MAVVQSTALVVLLLISIYNVKRCAFIGSDVVGLTVGKVLKLLMIQNISFSHYYGKLEAESLVSVFAAHRQVIATTILLLLCDDIETCSGPERYIPELNDVLKGKGVRTFHQNVRGLLSNSGQVAELLHSFEAIDILSMSETHINDELMYEHV